MTRALFSTAIKLTRKLGPDWSILYRPTLLPDAPCTQVSVKKTTADRMHGGYNVAPERMAKTVWLFYAPNLLAL